MTERSGRVDVLSVARYLSICMAYMLDFSLNINAIILAHYQTRKYELMLSSIFLRNRTSFPPVQNVFNQI